MMNITLCQDWSAIYVIIPHCLMTAILPSTYDTLSDMLFTGAPACWPAGAWRPLPLAGPQ